MEDPRRPEGLTPRDSGGRALDAELPCPHRLGGSGYVPALWLSAGDPGAPVVEMPRLAARTDQTPDIIGKSDLWPRCLVTHGIEAEGPALRQAEGQLTLEEDQAEQDGPEGEDEAFSDGVCEGNQDSRKFPLLRRQTS